MAGVNKVIGKNGEVILDISNDTVTAALLAQGATAHDAKGDLVQGIGPDTTIIKDDAGAGDIGYVWSADKSSTEINNLKSAYFAFRDKTGLTDLNNAITPGWFYLGTSEYSNLPSDVPSISTAKLLKVYPLKSDTSGVIMQELLIFTTSYTGDTWIRYRTGGTNPSWTDWVKISSKKDIENSINNLDSKMFAFRDKTGLTDLNNAITPGWFYLGTSEYSNLPSDVPSISTAKLLKVYQLSGNTNGVILQELSIISSSYSGDTWIRFRTGSSNPQWVSWKKNVSKKDIEELQNKINTKRSRFNGKKISIIGDSLSTYEGYTDMFNLYPEWDVTDVNDTWWKQVINNSGATLELNSSRGGSGAVKRIDRLSFYERTTETAIGNPDIVFVCLGVNDPYIDTEGEKSGNGELGEYDFTTSYENLTETQFRPAYIKGIKALQSRLPNAQIICIAAHTKAIYKDSIRYIAEQLGVEYIDIDGYDRSGDGTHPKLLGMQQMASMVLFPTDVNLYQSHYPADAKVIGDELQKLNTVLKDITQMEMIKGWLKNSYIPTADETVDLDNPSISVAWNCAIVDCQANQKFTINGTGVTNARLWAFIDSNNNVLSRAEANTTAKNLVITAPENAVKLIINNKDNGVVCYKGINNTYFTLCRSNTALTDLNDATQVGYYSFAYNAVCENMPEEIKNIQRQLFLKVYPMTFAETAFIVQELVICSGTFAGTIYTRTRTGGSKPEQRIWSDWVKVASKDIDYIKDAYFTFRSTTGLSDLNDATEIGYYILSASVAYANIPSELGENFKAASILKNYRNGIDVIYTIQELTILSGSFSGNIYVRRRAGYAPGIWGDWAKVSSMKDIEDLINEISQTRNTIIEDDYDFVERASQGENKGINLRVMSYNICNYDFDTGVSGGTRVIIPPNKLANLHKMLMEVNPDIICTQEDRKYIGDNNTYDSNNYLFYPKYPYSIFNVKYVMNTNIRSKVAFTACQGMVYSTESLRAIRYCTYALDNNKTLLVISTHPGLTVEARSTEYEELFAWIKGEIDLRIHENLQTTQHVPNYDYCIIGSDTNSATSADRTTLANLASTNGFVLANGGVLGWIDTHPRSSEFKPIDNIIVSNNIIINNIQVLTGWYDRLYSDHVPVYCDVTLI